MTKLSARPRRLYIDWARGLAVLIMIEAHALDAWTRVGDRRGPAFRDATVLGGFAAPLFLWLAGLSLALSAANATRRTGGRLAGVEVVCRRGLEIFILAFLFRLQAFIVSPGNPLIAIFRVDILNVMGPAIAAAGVVWGLTASARGLVAIYAGIATAIAMVTPILRNMPALGALPIWVQWYLKPAAEYTTFTLFPWAGFVFAGAVVGVLIGQAGNEPGERRLHAALASVGAALIALGFYAAAQPSIYRASSFWTSSPTFFAIRLGVMTCALPAIYAVSRMAAWKGAIAPLERLGRHSLFVYWIHVELVYGYATWPLHHRLPLWGTAVAYGVFTALVYRIVVVKERFVDDRRFPRIGAVESSFRVGHMTNLVASRIRGSGDHRNLTKKLLI